MNDETALTDADGADLIKIARDTIEAAVTNRPRPVHDAARHPRLQEHRGAFVTLNQRGRLRGCIGTFLPENPLLQVVEQMAVAAATKDPRFQPVTDNELADIDIEISVLSPLRKTDDPLSLELGVHGIYIKSGFHAGTYLPQVATEHNMTKEDFLSSCCAHKAGLEPDAWKDPATDVYLYTAQIFQEK